MCCRVLPRITSNDDLEHCVTASAFSTSQSMEAMWDEISTKPLY